ncbi:toxin-activating lysine-acyltransferase, partial [Natronospirillum operosum]
TWPLWSLDQDILPPLMLGQYKLYLDEQQNPVGFVTWAWLDEQGKQKMLDDEGPLKNEEWDAGTNAMVNDFVAPWGHAKQIVGDLKRNVFRDRKVFSIGRASDGRIRKIYHWRGVEYKDPVYRTQQADSATSWSRVQRIRWVRTHPPNNQT